MQKIGAWIYNPDNQIIRGMSKRAAVFEVYCEGPGECDLFNREQTCLHCSGVRGCKFGRKVKREGFTKAARKYHTWMKDARSANEGFIGKLKPLTAWNRVFFAQGHWYLPYSFMSKGMHSGAPLESPWVPDAEMTVDLLTKICTARPRAVFGGGLTDYQEKEVPKFISDLNRFYPELFDRLPEDQRARLENIDHTGRVADIHTCAPGTYVFAKKRWKWDGEHLVGTEMLFQPVRGEVEIRIRPEAGEKVTISEKSQVTPETVFLD